MSQLDKSAKDAYVWYSSATNTTGSKLAEALGMKHGTTQPKGQVPLILCWGAKTKDAVSLGKTPVLNHPDNIRLNRNKLDALGVMEKAGVSVAPFVPVAALNKIGTQGCKVMLPCVARTSYHQGGKGFWDCPTKTHLEAAVREGAQYFQNLIEIKDEYRLHLFDKELIYAAKKVKRTSEETAEVYVRQELEKQQTLATKHNRSFDEATARTILEQQARVFAQNGANMLIRSNRAGWKFSRVKSVPEMLVREAIKALGALNLNFGAVDCCIDAAGKPYVLEVNTGPGLEESTFDAWVEVLTKNIEEILCPKTLFQQIKEAPGKKSAASNSTSDAKTRLKTRVELMTEMVNAANASEAEVLESVFGKMFK